MSDTPTQTERATPARWLRRLLLFHLAAWTLVPWLAADALPLDTVEALAWGCEWELGYDKHPPLSAWAAETAAQLSLRSDWALYLLSAACAAVTIWAAWRIALRFMPPPRALIAATLLEGVLYLTYTIPEFNVNVLQTPIWALASLTFLRALDRDRLADWAITGALLGLGLLSKYLAGALGLAMAFAVLAHRRDMLKRPGPYLSAVVSVAVVAPHLWWAQQHDWITLAYGLDRAGASDRALLDHLVNPLTFLGAQAAALAPAALLVLVWSPRRRTPPDDQRERRNVKILAWLALGPVAILCALSLATGLELASMWGAPMLSLVPVLAMTRLDVRYPAHKKRDGSIWLGVVLAAPLIAYASGPLLSLPLRDKPKRVNYPGRAIAHEAAQRWRDAAGDRPLTVAIGNEWDAGLVGWYAPDRPSVYIHADPARAPWVSDERVRREGALILWLKHENADAPPDEHDPMPVDGAESRFAAVRPLPDIVAPYPKASENRAVRYGVALVPPQPGADDAAP